MPLGIAFLIIIGHVCVVVTAVMAGMEARRMDSGQDSLISRYLNKENEPEQD